jgi:hypothetical protein
MAKIEIPSHLVKKIGAEMKMDTHWVDVKLMDGRVITNLVVRGGRYITGRDADLNGEGALPFNTEDIQAIRRHAFIFRRLWPFWPG